MLKISDYSFIAAVMSVALALVCYVLSLSAVRVVRGRAVLATAAEGGGTADVTTSRPGAGLAAYGVLTGWLALGFLTLSLTLRAIVTGHAPFANMYEFTLAFAWGALACNAYFERRYHQRTISIIALGVSLGLLMYALMIPATADPLVPALQNTLLLSVHVAVAVIAYGAFSVSFAAAVLFLIQPEKGRRGLPRPALLDEIAHRGAMIGYPFLTLVIVLGAVWAEISWGRYWSWDPKETASLVTWLVYGAYLHARVVHGWRGRRAAWLLVIGFVATLFTFYGNLFFGGLHSYAAIWL